MDEFYGPVNSARHGWMSFMALSTVQGMDG